MNHRMSGTVVLTPEHLERVVRHFGSEDAMVFDVETTGVNRGIPHLAPVSWISLATTGMAVSIPMGHPNGDVLVSRATKKLDKATRKFTNIPAVWNGPPEQMRPSEVWPVLKPLFDDPDRLLIGSGISFDLTAVAKYMGGSPPAGEYTDTVIIQWLLDENRKHNGLKPLVKEYFGHDYDTEGVGKCVEGYPFSKVARYAYLDAKYTWLLWRLLEPRIVEEGLEQVYALEQDVIRPVVKMRLRGARVDREALLRLRAEYGTELVDIEADIYRAAGQRFNINSNPQKQKILFGPKGEGGQGLKPSRFTDNNAPSCDAASLERYPGNRLAVSLLGYSDVHKLLTTYVDGYLGVEGDTSRPCQIFDGRIHADFVQYGTVTGRMSCVLPDTLIEMPRDLRAHPDGIPMRDVKVGDLVYAFTWDKRLTLSRVNWVGPTKIADSTIKVTVRDKFGKVTSFTATPDHKVRLYSGDWREAGRLSVGDRLMGMLQRRFTKDGYAFFPPSKKRALPGKTTGGKISEHRLVYSMFHHKNLSTKFDVHHKDHNRINNRWDNLDYMFKADHLSSHAATTQAHVQAMLDGAELTVHLKTLKRLAKKWDLAPTNHTIISIEQGPSNVEVWDMEVDGTHNFIGGDVCLHNCRSPNLQNIPRPDTDKGRQIRGLFIAEEGRRLVRADYGQIELVILAHYSKAAALVSGFHEGVDAHTVTASKVFNVDPGKVTPDMRQVAKGINFAVVYGAGPEKVALMSGVSVTEAKGFLKIHQREFPEVYRFKSRVLEVARSRRPPYIRTLLGRKRRLPGLNYADKGMRGYAERQAVNSLIQGSAADIIKLAMVRLDQTLPEGSSLILSVHDELVVSTSVDSAEEVEVIVREAMLGEDISRLLSVPMTIDSKIVTRWDAVK